MPHRVSHIYGDAQMAVNVERAARERASRRTSAKTSETRFTPLESKLLAPRSRRELVPRTPLVRRLRSSAARPLVSVTAPPGYGKTTLVAQWSEADERPFAWVSLDRSDNDPVELLTYVALALNRIEPLGAPVFDALSSRHPVVDRIVARLGKAISAVSRPFVLVLDDVHAITSKPSTAALATLVRHLPTGSQFALVTRTESRLPLGRLRAEGALLELTARDLAFDARAADALLSAVGVRLGPKDLALIVRKTEGWPAGLYLAALALKGDGTVVTPPNGFTGDDGRLVDYFGDQVLDRLPPSESRFLTRTSILERLSGDLCDAVLDGSGSAARLRELERRNLFLVSLDGRRAWYRYHTLFGEMLRRRLHDEDPELELGLHGRASAWYAEHGEPEQAIIHATEAGAVDLAGDLVWTHVNDYLARGRRGTIRRWLEYFDDEQIVEYPPLALSAAWSAIEGDEAGAVERWTAAAAQGSFDGLLPDGGASLESAVALLRAVTANEGVTRMGEDAARARELEGESSRWRASACFLEGVALRLSGSSEQARWRLGEGVRIADALGIAKVKALCLAQLALLEIADDAWEEAESLIAGAKRELEEHRLLDSPTMKGAFAASVLAKAYRGKLEEAKRELPHARRLMALPTQVFPWLEIEARLDLSRALLLLGDKVAARTRFRETRALMRLTPDPGILGERLEQLSELLDALPPNGLDHSALTSAELRLLHFLPTHLSFREIGDQIFVSRNTVKTQAASIYRKLDVGGRSEAVERARELGLVET